MHSIRQIRVVQALAQHRHFGRAARALGVSQPNLTRSLKQIEDALGVILFDREGVTPTSFGEIVLRYGERAVADFYEMTREVVLARGLEIGELRLVTGPYPADISGAKAVGALLQRRPRLQVEIRSANWEEALAQVASGAADLGFAETTATPANPELVIEPVRRSRLTFFCAKSHPLAGKTRVILEDVLEFPWAGPSLPARIGAALPKVDRPFAVYDAALDRFRPRAVVGSFGIAKEIVLGGMAISAAIPCQIKREIEDGTCVWLPLDDTPWLTLDYGFIFKRNRALAPAATAFMEIVRGLEGAIPH